MGQVRSSLRTSAFAMAMVGLLAGVSACGKPKVDAELAAKGEQAASICVACHTFRTGKHLIGPSLAHVYGRKAGTVQDYVYSDAMKASGITWDEASLTRFISDPQGTVHGTNMAIQPIPADTARAIVEYLKTK